MRAGGLVRTAWSLLLAADLLALVLVVAAHADITGKELLVGLATVVVAAVASTTGVAVVRRRPGHLVGRLLLAVGVGFGLKALFASYAVWALRGHRDVPFTTGAAWLQGWVALVVFPVGLTLLLLAFPSGAVGGRLARTAGWLAVAGGLLVLVERLLEPVPVVAGLHVVLLHENPTAVHAGVVDALAAGWPLSLLALVLAVVDLVRRARAAALARSVRLLAAAAVLLGLLAGVALVVSLRGDEAAQWVQITFVLVVGVVVPVVVAFAVVDAPTLELERLLDRTLTWAGLSVLVIGGYVGVVLYLTALLGRGSDGVLKVLATAGVAVAFQPARRVVERGVRRLVYGPDGDPRRAALGLARSSTELPAVAEALRRGLGAHRVVVALDAVGHAAAGGDGATTTYPLAWDGEQVGRLEIDVPTAAELPAGRARLRDDVADLLARAGHEARQRDRLAVAQARRLAATADERRRLRHDLHDGVGPAISGLRMTVAAARRHLPADPAGARALLNQATVDLERLAHEVRVVLDRLGPGPLASRGLSGAIADTAAQLSLQASLELDPSLDGLPPAVSEALLRIAQEALHNVSRHAQVDRCRVVARVTDADVELVVEDEGVGPLADHAGVGTTSMRVRAADLGGTCTTTARPGGGTTVRALLPLAVAEAHRA